MSRVGEKGSHRLNIKNGIGKRENIFVWLTHEIWPYRPNPLWANSALFYYYFDYNSYL